MAGEAGVFSEEQFWEACAELKQPALAGADWELLVEAMGLRFYRLRDQETGLYKYKVFGVLKDCPPALLADVYMDLDYRKEWDQNVEELYERECNGQTVVYWQVRYPAVMSNRDKMEILTPNSQGLSQDHIDALCKAHDVYYMYVYIRERRELDVEGRDVYVVLAQSTSYPEFPERSGVIRVTQYTQKLALMSDGGNGSKVFMYYFDNPGGQIPTRLINWAAKKGVPEFLKELVKACRNYSGRT